MAVIVKSDEFISTFLLLTVGGFILTNVKFFVSVLVQFVVGSVYSYVTIWLPVERLEGSIDVIVDPSNFRIPPLGVVAGVIFEPFLHTIAGIETDTDGKAFTVIVFDAVLEQPLFVAVYVIDVEPATLGVKLFPLTPVPLNVPPAGLA